MSALFRRFGLLLAVALAVPAQADSEVTLRLSCMAPEGTAWARELRAYARDVAATTGDTLHLKWYLGGITGDDVVSAERVHRNQLDGEASGGMLCERLSPTMRAIHMVAETREDTTFLLNRLHPEITEEFKKAGYVYLGAGGVGPDVLFSREPIHSLNDLRQSRLWVWDLDEVATSLYPAVGVQTVALPVSDAYRAYEEKKVDGFIAIPAAALAFQWSAQTRYVSDLRMGFVSACVLIAQRAYDQIPLQARDAFRAATAKLQVRFADLGRQQDEALMHGFTKQGLKPLPVTPEFRTAYAKAARAVREQLQPKLVPKATLARVQDVLDQFRRGGK
jgi:TRAP-type C4-dicarboxylate transport system substrate-binding protein